MAMNPAVGIIGSLLGAFVGAYAVYYFAVKQLAVKRRLELRERQLVEFYSPSAAIAQNLRLRHDIANEILKARDHAPSSSLPADMPDSAPAERTQHVIDNARDLLKYTGYDLEKWKDDLLSQYRRLLDLFTERYWLADRETRAYYAALLRYLEVYDRLDNDTMTIDVANHLGHQTNSQRPLFDHLEAKVDELRNELLIRG